jgi:hypothetical protein
MVIVFMVSRLRRVSILFAVLAGSALVTAAACSKVPLLAPSGSSIVLTVTSTALPLNGTTQIIAQVVQAGGTAPQDGTLVTFTTSLGSIQPPEAQTKGGRVTATFNAGTTNGTATITASSGGASASGTTGAKVAIGTAAVGSVRVSANPTLLPALGGSSTITAVVLDNGGHTRPGSGHDRSERGGHSGPQNLEHGDGHRGRRRASGLEHRNDPARGRDAGASSDCGDRDGDGDHNGQRRGGAIAGHHAAGGHPDRRLALDVHLRG